MRDMRAARAEVSPNRRDTESLVVLPAMRLNRLHEALDNILGDRHLARQVMDAVEDHIERDAYRWGNACSVEDCGKLLSWSGNGWFVCEEHGAMRHAPTTLLIGFKPVTL